MTEKNPSSIPYQFVKDFGISGITASISKSMTYPIDKVNMILTFQEQNIKQGLLQKRYQDIFDCIKTVGPRFLWKNNLVSIIRYLPAQSLNFAFNGLFKRIFDFKREDGFIKYFFGNIASGGLAGFTSTVILYQKDMLQMKIANDFQPGKQRQYEGMIDAYKKVIRNEGILSLYKGFLISSLGVTIYRSIYFGFFDSFKHLAPFKDSFLANLVLGWTIAYFGSFVTRPIDIVRAQMLTNNKIYVSIFQSFQLIISKQGAAHLLFNNLNPLIIRGFTGGATISGFNLIQTKLN